MKRLPKYLMPFAGMPGLPACPYRDGRVTGGARYVRYLAASAISLGADLSIFYLVLQIDVSAVAASVLGYISGLVVHWLLSSRLVFADKIPSGAAARRRQQLLFAISAILGLTLTAGVVECGLRMGLAPGLSKLAAIVFSFQLTYVFRRAFVFR